MRVRGPGGDPGVPMPEIRLTWSSSEDVVSTRSGALSCPLPSMLTKSVTEYLTQQTGMVSSRAMQTAMLVLKKPCMSRQALSV